MLKAWGCFALGTNPSSLLDKEEILSLAAKEEKVPETFRRESLIEMTGQLRIASYTVPWLATVFRARHAWAHCHGQCLAAW